jgi:IS1 family transposase
MTKVICVVQLKVYEEVYEGQKPQVSSYESFEASPDTFRECIEVLTQDSITFEYQDHTSVYADSADIYLDLDLEPEQFEMIKHLLD